LVYWVNISGDIWANVTIWADLSKNRLKWTSRLKRKPHKPL